MLILAHRGGHDPETRGVRENTLEAFRAAADLGADGVELDARLFDGCLLIHHDEIEVVEPWMPTLAETLDTCAAMTLVNVEIKARTDDPSGEIAAALRNVPNVFVSSFNLTVLDAFHGHAPGIPTGWLTISGYDQIDAVATAAQRGHRGINPPHTTVTVDLVRRAHDAGLQVSAWTVNDADRMRELRDWGTDVLITDYPALAIRALG
jgi:glycerophosphoryl diester phosphodiesterase